LKPSTESCIVSLQLSVLVTVTFLGSMDLLKVTEIVLVTATSVVPSAGEIVVTVGTVVSAVLVVDSSLLPGVAHENVNSRNDSNAKYSSLKMPIFHSTKPPFVIIQKVIPMPS
jgi:hypothetical protein